MSRRPTPIGTFGVVTFTAGKNGKVTARTRFRDEDGVLRQVQASGASRREADQQLKLALRDRHRPAYSAGLTPDTRFASLAERWIKDLDLEQHLSAKTREVYEWNMRKIVLPAFGNLTLREVTVARVDRFLKLSATKSYSRAKQARTVLSLALGLAVRYGVIATNPVASAARLRKPSSVPQAPEPADIRRIRAAIANWRRGPGLSGPRPDGQLGAIVDVMLGTSARIGEVLAIRRRDVDLDADPPTVRIAGTLVSVRGKSVYRQEHPKSARSIRSVALPSYTVDALRARLAGAKGNAEDLVFQSRNGTPLIPNNVRRRLRAVLEDAGIEAVTPHAFRRAVATAVDRSADATLASEMLGHTSPEITRRHYIEREELVDPATAEIVEEFGDEDDE